MKIAVIGAGTAGVQTIAYFLARLPTDIEVYSIHDPSIKILGIGESTTGFLPRVLSEGCGFTMLDHGDELDATTKHGVKWSNWRKESFNTHILPPYHGMHFNNFKLAELAFRLASEKWPTRFYQLQGDLDNMIQSTEKVTLSVSGVYYDFDYVVDCRGYPTDYSDYTICENFPLNHALVHTIPFPGTWNYTHHQAHQNGWMFGIPLKTRQGWGYLYNDTITNKDDAIQDIADIFNVHKDSLNLREFSFKNYFANNFINGRIILNGNRALFFEPMEALSGTFYEAISIEAVNIILQNTTVDLANARLKEIASRYEDFILFVYHGGSTFDSDFWNITKKKAKERLDTSDTWSDTYKMITALIESGHADNEMILIPPCSIKLWLSIDSHLHGYFKK
jgi:hypothetical protein